MTPGIRTMHGIRIPPSQSELCFHRELDRTLIRLVERGCCISELKRARRVTGLEACTASAVEEIRSQRTQAALLALRP